jgi:RNA polymerase sigma-70 factor (ECF subfamily)
MERSVVLTDVPASARLGEPIESWTPESEVRMTMNSARANLPETQRKVLELAYLNGMTQTEIAEHLRNLLVTIKAWMRAGIQRFREIVSSQVA